MADSPDIAALLAAHDAWVDSRSLTFRERMERIATAAALATAREVERRARIEGLLLGGALLPRASAQRLLRKADQIFLDRLEREGWFLTVEALTAQLAVPGTQQRQAVLFGQTFRAINKTLANPLPDPKWLDRDRRFFESRQIVTAKAINSQVESIARTATSRMLLSSGAVSFGELMSAMTANVGRGVAGLESLAATALSTHYRVLHDRSFDLIEEQTEKKLLLVYAGPKDKLNRPFCRRMLTEGKPRTREQIKKLDASPSTLPPLTAGGGWNCRHLWIMDGVK